MQLFEELESEVRGYCRSWPTVFDRAHGWTLVDESGREYLDFFAGAGALNYGHNHPVLIDRLCSYLGRQGIVHGLDMATTAKREFMERFQSIVLEPRGLDYKLQFPGPTGTNSVEAALKLARKVTGRHRVVSFTNAFHGMTLGSLAVTGNSMKRRGAGVPLTMADSMPFQNFGDDDVDTLGYFSSMLADDGSGIDSPAAVILETVQAEGGINVATDDWLRRLGTLCKKYGILLIIDDIQVGCGRTGDFFSWESAGLEPDIVCLSKSLSGSGLPMALTLLKPEHDIWEPGEHNGTFRGNNAAFVTAGAALELFWTDDTMTRETERKAHRVRAGLEALAVEHDGVFVEARGRGLIQGLQTAVPELADEITTEAFERGLVIETAGSSGDVVKFLPPLIVDDAAIDRALEILAAATDAVVDRMGEELRDRTEPLAAAEVGS
ncbi:MAG: diaminobutyrate--2-oxoglutarate transaminase [Actinomycetota bacterium]|nr:diaminobutyrate--2-oxoglutarate transaminase [Actinomycetota bacterium]